MLASAPLSATENEGGVWITGNYTDSFGADDEPGPWRYTLQFQGRKFTLADGTRQAVGRTGIGYQLNDRMTLWGGYAYYHTHVNHVGTAREHRIWQQLSWTLGKGDWGTFKSRSRLEQRFRNGRDGTGWHLRQQFRGDFPVGDSRRWTLIAGDEIFFYLRDTTWSKAGYAQNRLFLGAGYKFDNGLRVEAGYMNQFIRLRGLPDLMNHLLIVGFRL
jgi:hypothetical protein